MEITRGIIEKAQRVVIYGPEGIGKTTFAMQFPEPLFIDTEGGTAHLDVSRLPKPTSWAMLLEEITFVKQNPGVCKTLVIDTIDWAETLCVEAICAKYKKSGLEDFGYGNGYVYAKEELGRMLNSLQEVIDGGINVVLTAHAQMRKFEQPDELGAYDRWELKLGKKTSSQTAPLVKEWADMVLFANYETVIISSGDGKKNKAQGSKRVMYTEHHACWDAKNRAGLPPKLPVEDRSIKAAIEPGEAPKPDAIAPKFEVVSDEEAKECDDALAEVERNAKAVEAEQDAILPELRVSANHQKLYDILKQTDVTIDEIRSIVAKKGYYTADTPISKYDPEFVGGVLVGAWQQVYNAIISNRQK